MLLWFSVSIHTFIRTYMLYFLLFFFFFWFVAYLRYKIQRLIFHKTKAKQKENKQAGRQQPHKQSLTNELIHAD